MDQPSRIKAAAADAKASQEKCRELSRTAGETIAKTKKIMKETQDTIDRIAKRSSK